MSEDLDRDLAIRRQRKKRFLGAPAPPQRLAQERSRKAPRLRRAMVDDETVDVVFTLYCATLVFSMQIGFTLLEVGSVSIRNTKNILLKNLLDLCVTSVVFYLFGYGLSNGESEHGFAVRVRPRRRLNNARRGRTRTRFSRLRLRRRARRLCRVRWRNGFRFNRMRL